MKRSCSVNPKAPHPFREAAGRLGDGLERAMAEMPPEVREDCVRLHLWFTSASGKSFSVQVWEAAR
ncbi:MAG: hypothetical protein ACPGQD_07205 [Planctomycetota bacterium]